MIGTAVIAIIVVVLSNIAAYVLNEHSVLSKCLPAPRLLFCSNRRLKRRPEQFWALDTADPEWLTTSFFVPVWVLAALRLLIVLYFAAEVLIERFTAPNGLGQPEYVWVSFFTDWTFCIFGASGLLGFLVTLQRMARRSKAAKVRPNAEHRNGSVEEIAATSMPQAVQHAAVQNPDVTVPPPMDASAPTVARTAAQGCDTNQLVRRWTWHEVLYVLVFETSAAATLFLTVFYWAALAGSGNRQADNIMKHGTNNILILLDTVLSRAPFVSYHFQVVLLYGTVYLIFMWAIWLPVEDYWVYAVFDWNKWRALGAYIVLPIALFIAFVIWTIIAAVREWAGRRLATRWSSAAPAAKSQPMQLDMQPLPQPVAQSDGVAQQHSSHVSNQTELTQ